MGKALVALDTNHIKKYVFGTNKLKEIRGASSLLDYLNRIVMKELARIDPSFDEKKCCIYVNGGSGLFLIEEKLAEEFGRRIQNAFRDVTGGGSSVTYVVQELPPDAPSDIDKLLTYPLHDTLALLRYRLRAEKDKSPALLTLPSHPFMRQCSACGIEYASPDKLDKEGEPDPDEEEGALERSPDESNELYCISCQEKRKRDVKIKRYIKAIEAKKHQPYDEYLWVEVIKRLRKNGYDVRPQVERPRDFNVFRNFKGAKEYFGIIYADGNGMGKASENCHTLKEYQDFASKVDEAIYDAVCFAIAKHLKIEEHIKPKDELEEKLKHPLFPFDILMLGGDDVMMVVPASVAMDVALTIATKFHELTEKKYTLSVGVVLAPVKYPFGLLQELVSDTLKSSKKKGAKKDQKGKESEQQEGEQKPPDYGDTRINFMTVTGSTSQSFSKVYNGLHKRTDEGKKAMDFYATLRPYNVEQLEHLLEAIREGHKKELGRTKLHQVREAVLKQNLTTSVSDGLAVLRNWRPDQRDYVVKHIYTLGGIYQQPHQDERKPGTLFPRVTFPWFADGERTYRTSLLDFVELYDFVTREGGK